MLLHAMPINTFLELLQEGKMSESKIETLKKRIEDFTVDGIVRVTLNGSTKYTAVMITDNKDEFLIGIAKRCTYKKKYKLVEIKQNKKCKFERDGNEEDKFSYATGVCIAASRLFPK